MKFKVSVFATLVFMLMAGIVAAADVTGKWTAQVPGRQGQTREVTFNFKVEGEKLTGTMSGRQGDNPIADGKVSGDTISFTASGGQAKLIFKGKVSGDEIKFTRQREGADQVQEFTAKRAK
jgi:hypothetical protein